MSEIKIYNDLVKIQKFLKRNKHINIDLDKNSSKFLDAVYLKMEFIHDGIKNKKTIKEIQEVLENTYIEYVGIDNDLTDWYKVFLRKNVAVKEPFLGEVWGTVSDATTTVVKAVTPEVNLLGCKRKLTDLNGMGHCLKQLPVNAYNEAKKLTAKAAPNFHVLGCHISWDTKDEIVSCLGKVIERKAIEAKDAAIAPFDKKVLGCRIMEPDKLPNCIANTIKNELKPATNIGKTLIDKINNIISKIGEILTEIKNIGVKVGQKAEEVVNKGKEKVIGVKDTIIGVFDNIKIAVGDVFDGLKNASNIFKNSWNDIGNFVISIVNLIKKIYKVIEGLVIKLWDFLVLLGKNVMWIINNVPRYIRQTWSFSYQLINSIKYDYKGILIQIFASILAIKMLSYSLFKVASPVPNFILATIISILVILKTLYNPKSTLLYNSIWDSTSLVGLIFGIMILFIVKKFGYEIVFSSILENIIVNNQYIFGLLSLVLTIITSGIVITSALKN